VSASGFAMFEEMTRVAESGGYKTCGKKYSLSAQGVAREKADDLTFTISGTTLDHSRLDG
jgi:hypothetical protein